MNADRRAARRRFICAYHPDRGGDPEVFVAGLRSFDDQNPSSPPTTRVRIADTPNPVWPVSLVTVALRKVRRPHRRG